MIEEIVTHKVTFDSNGGSEVETQTVEHGKTATKPADPTKEGYTFIGWFNGEAEYDFNAAVTADVKLTAKWQIKTYTVSFNTDGGSTVASQTVEHGKTATKPANPTKCKYVFQGWFNGDTQYDFTSPVTSNINLVAKWQDTIYISATLSLSESIDIVMYISDISDSDHPTKYTVEYSFAGGNTITKTLGRDISINKNGEYGFVVANCSSKQLTDTVSLVVKYDGQVLRTVSSYSAQTYCNNTIRKHPKEGDQVAALCKAVLEYGADAQVFFDNYNADKMANSVYNDTAKVASIVIPDNWPITVSGKMANAGLSGASVTLDLKSRTELLFYLTPSGNKVASDYTIKVKDLNLNKDADFVVSTDSDGRVVVRVLGIYAKYLGHMYELSVTNGGNTFKVSYSPMTYAHNKSINGGNNLKTLMKALYNYAQIAENFFD